MAILKSNSKKSLTEQLLLDLLNGKDVSEEIICLYNNYILSASTMTTNNIISGNTETYIDEDLMQVIKMNIYMSLPNLRKNLKRYLDKDDDFNINVK